MEEQGRGTIENTSNLLCWLIGKRNELIPDRFFSIINDEEETYGGFSLTALLYQLACKLHKQERYKNSKIILFIHDSKDTFQNKNTKIYYLGHPKYNKYNKKNRIFLSINKFLNLNFKSKYYGFIALRQFLESIYYREGTYKILDKVHFRDLEQQIERYNAPSFSDIIDLIVNSEKQFRSDGNFEYIIKKGEYAKLFNEKSGTINKIFGNNKITIIRYSDLGFRYPEEMPAYRSLLLFYLSKKLSDLHKNGIFLLDDLSRFIQFETDNEGQPRLSYFSNDTLDYCRGGIRHGEPDYNENILISNLILDRFPDNPYYILDNYYEIISSMLHWKLSFNIIFNLNSDFRSIFEKHGGLTLQSSNKLDELGKLHESWDWERRALIPFLVGYNYSLKLYPKKIFVSSPIEGYEELRKKAVETIERSGHKPIAQEYFGAGGTAIETSLIYVDDSEYLVLILWKGGPGTYLEDRKKFFSQLECERAKEKGITIFPFVQREFLQEDIDYNKYTKHGEEFKKWIDELKNPNTGKFCGLFEDTNDFVQKLRQTLRENIKPL